MLKSRIAKVIVIFVALALAGQLVLTVTTRKIGYLPLSKIPGYFVYLDNGKIKVYFPRRGEVARKKHFNLGEASVLLASSRTPDRVIFFSKHGTSGLLRVSNTGSKIGIFPNSSLSGDKPGNITKWRLEGDKLYTIVERKKQATLMRLDMHGHLDNIKLPMPPGLKMQEEWSSAPSVHDGTNIVFGPPVKDGPWPIILADTSNRTVKVLAYGHNPKWSPDGSKIAFTCGFTLNVMDVASGKISSYTIWRPRTLLDLSPWGTPGFVSRITWLGNSGYVACELAPSSKVWQHRIVVIELSTKMSSQLPISTDPAGWAWIPNSQ